MKTDLVMNEYTLGDLFNSVLAELHLCRSASDGSWYDRGYEDALWATLEQIRPRLITNRFVNNGAILDSTP